MAVSVRMEPILERELELAARRKGITKSQFIIEAVQRALGRKNPYELMNALKAEESRPPFGALAKAYQGHEQPYASASAKARIVAKLKEKHERSAG